MSDNDNRKFEKVVIENEPISKPETEEQKLNQHEEGASSNKYKELNKRNSRYKNPKYEEIPDDEEDLEGEENPEDDEDSKDEEDLEDSNENSKDEDSDENSGNEDSDEDENSDEDSDESSDENSDKDSDEDPKNENLKNEEDSENKNPKKRENFKRDNNNFNENKNNFNKNEDSKDKKEDDEEKDDDENVDVLDNIVENVKSKLKITKNITFAIFKILANPIFWIILGVIMIIIFLSSTLSTVGQNDYNIMCDESGVGVISIDPTADDFTRQSAIVSWLTSTPFEVNGGRPLSREQAIGIIGNMMSESYGANPRAIQGDNSLSQWEFSDNNTVLSWGSVGGKAVGIVQWDGNRRVELVNFAISEGTQWHDLTTQLKFLKKEMDSDEKEQLIAGGFTEIGKTLEDYTKIWNKHFERSAKAGTPAGDNPRIANATAFSSAYEGGSFSAGLSDNCIGGLFAGGGVDTSNIIELAVAASWPNRSDSLGSCSSLTNCGQAFATNAYKQAKIAAEAATNKDSIQGLLASCDRFVATMYRATGHDSNFPWGDSSVQGDYMKESPNWEKVSCQERHPGDVLWREGHVMLYVGNINGQDSIASASVKKRTAALSKVSCQGDNFVADGDLAIGFRKVR